jgi:hypothetical protein
MYCWVSFEHAANQYTVDSDSLLLVHTYNEAVSLLDRRQTCRLTNLLAVISNVDEMLTIQHPECILNFVQVFSVHCSSMLLNDVQQGYDSQLKTVHQLRQTQRFAGDP